MKQEVIDKIDKVIEKVCDEITADDSITRPDDMKALAELITARAQVKEDILISVRSETIKN